MLALIVAMLNVMPPLTHAHVHSTGNLRDHPPEGEGQEVHGGHERPVLEPAARRAPAQRLAQRPEGDPGGPLSAQPHRHAAGLRGGDAHLLRRRADQAPRLPLCLHPGAVPRLLDRRGCQHHPLLHMSRLKRGSNTKHYPTQARAVNSSWRSLHYHLGFFNFFFFSSLLSLSLQRLHLFLCLKQTNWL